MTRLLRTIALWLLPAAVLCLSFWFLRAVPTGRTVALLPTATPVRPPGGSAPAGSGPSGFPVRVDLPGGGHFVLPRPPERILLANANMVDLVSRLVPADRVLALPEQALTWSRLCEVDGGFRQKATFRFADAELVLALAPDLLLCSPFNAALAESGAKRVPTLSLPQPRSLAELRSIIALCGTVLGAGEEAEKLCADMDRRIAALHERAAHRATLGAVSYSNFGGSGWSAGADTMTDVMIRLCGMRNLTADARKRGEVRLTFEELVVLDPDVMILPARFGEASSGTAAVLATEPSLAGVRAVAGGMLVHLHPRFFSTGSQEVVAGAEAIAAEVDRLLAAADGPRHREERR